MEEEEEEGKRTRGSAPGGQPENLRASVVRRACPGRVCTPLEAEVDRQGGLVHSDITLGKHERQYRHAFLLPYVNLEVLTKDPLKLLSLLYNRINSSPEQWAPYDNFLLNGQWKDGAFDLTYNGGCIVMYG